MRSDFATVRPAHNLPSLRRDSLRAHRERRLERETGIEPATNSLEGCDSTTELLPPTGCTVCSGPLSPVEQSLVGRGGFEPPKALGRQIYSLLHLTALQPPRPHHSA